MRNLEKRLFNLLVEGSLSIKKAHRINKKAYKAGFTVKGINLARRALKAVDKRKSRGLATSDYAAKLDDIDYKSLYKLKTYDRFKDEFKFKKDISNYNAKRHFPINVKGKIIHRIPKERQIGEGSLGQKRADRLFKAAQKKTSKGKVFDALSLYKKTRYATERNLQRLKKDKRTD